MVRLLMIVIAALVPSMGGAQDRLFGEQSVSPASSVGLKPFDPVAKVVAVKTRDGAGRLDCFTDSRNREFHVSYDAEGRLASVKATLREHISDVRSMGYDEQGRFAGAQLGAGYLLLVNYLADGTQVIRDRFGGLISRRGSLGGGYQVLQSNDPMGRLIAAVNGLDELLRATAGARN